MMSRRDPARSETSPHRGPEGVVCPEADLSDVYVYLRGIGSESTCGWTRGGVLMVGASTLYHE